jgi:hypothetical protein
LGWVRDGGTLARFWVGLGPRRCGRGVLVAWASDPQFRSRGGRETTGDGEAPRRLGPIEILVVGPRIRVGLAGPGRRYLLPPPFPTFLLLLLAKSTRDRHVLSRNLLNMSLFS